MLTFPLYGPRFYSIIMADLQEVIPIATPSAPPHDPTLTTSSDNTFIQTLSLPNREVLISSISHEDSPPPPPYSQVCPEAGLSQEENLSHHPHLPLLVRYTCLGTLLATLTCLTLSLVLLYVQLASLQEEVNRLDIGAVEGVRKELRRVVDLLEYNTSRVVQGLRDQVEMLDVRLGMIERGDNLSGRSYFTASKAVGSSPSSFNVLTLMLCAVIALSQLLM